MKALLVALALTTFLAAPAFAQDADAVVAKVGGKSITNAQVDVALEALGPQFANVPEEQRRARALDSLIDINAMAAKARDAGLQDSEAVKNRIDLLTNRALHNAYFEENIRNSVTDEELQAQYDSEIAGVAPEQEVRARHILVKTAEEAVAIIEELDNGADFAEIAKEKSTGPSGVQGGDLGFFGKGRMVPAFEKAAFELEPGSYTKEPVETQFGFHIIKVEESRDVPLPSLEQAKEQLRQIVLSEKYTAALEDARSSLSIEILDETLVLPASE